MQWKKTALFWQPPVDFLRIFLVSSDRRRLLLVFNYIIWLFLALISFLLVKHDPNIFWQLFISSLIAEVAERLIKRRKYWQRPLLAKSHSIPPGLVKKWYLSGSFPSGHTSKAAFFFLYILQYQIFNPVLYLLITGPLLLFRVLVGFHYPIDIVGGLVVGVISWWLAHSLIFPPVLVELIRSVFNLLPL